MLNICLSMSKYPLGSNLGGLGTGVGTGGLGRGLGLGFWVSGLSHAKLGSNLGGTGDTEHMSFYVKVSFRV